MSKVKNYCKTIILCGGKGTRMGELGQTIPKALVELHSKPILYHKIQNSINQEYREFIIATGYKGQMIVDACKTMDLDFSVVFSDSGEDAGMLRRIYEAQELFEERAIVTYGDSMANLELQSLIDFHLRKQSLLSIVTAPIQSPFGLVKSDHENHVLMIEEKPVLHYFIGTFVLEKSAFEFLPKQIINWPDGSGLIAFFKMLAAINKLYTYVHEGPDITFNTVEELSAAKEDYLKFYTHFK